MEKLFAFFAALMIWSMQTALATDVSGTISTNTTWTAAGSPYIVTSSITIQTGVALTIQSGVTVKFNDSQYLYVNGTLNADNVVFTTSNASPAAGKWGYIQIGNSTYSGTANISNSQIQYAQYFYVYKGTATLDNTDLINFSQYGAYVQTAGNLNMTGGNINTNASGAVTSGHGIYGYGRAMLTNVTIQHFANGIYLNNNFNLKLNSCSITNCTWPINYCASADLITSGTNSFAGNTNTAVNMGFSSFSDTLTLPALNIPYYFPNSTTVNSSGRLVIGSNTVLKFSNSTYLDVNGTLVANANEGENIYFTSILDDNWGGDTNKDGTTTAPTSGKWYGIRFQNPSDDTNCLMRRCKVRYAGYSNTGGISLFNASPTIDNCDLSNNYHGAYMQYASNPVFTNNIIGSSQMTPIAMSFEANPTMGNNTLSFSDNAYDAIGLIGGTLTADATLKIRSVTSVQNMTYLMLDQIIVPSGKTLTINKGIVIKSYTSSRYSYHRRIIVEGTLTANATPDSMITFTSARDDNYGNPVDCNKDGTITSPVVADWDGIVFNPGSGGTLNYCRIKYAEVYYYDFTTCSKTESVNGAAVAMIDASPTISNCEFKDLTYGISCYRASNPVISNNSMINIKYTPFCISGSSNPTFSAISFTNVGWRAIGLLGGNVCQNGTIKKRDVAGFTNITYVLLSDMIINSGTSVNVEPGVVIKVKDDTSNNGNIFVDGGFKTDGTSSQGVVFTSIKDDNEGNPLDSNGDGNATTPASGDWGSVKYRSTSDDACCLLNYTTIKYGGNTNEGGVTFENAGGQLKNSTVSNTSNYGVYCNGNSTSIVDNVIIQNCSKDPIAISLTSNPAFTNITFVSNFSQAIKIIEGTLSSNATLATRNVAGITNIAYIISQLTISSNARLTIQPDVVIKFRNDNYHNTFIKVNGNLIANGTASHKIYFTSFADDSKGGDSNNNGNASTPDKEDWGQGYYEGDNPEGGIRIENNSMVADTVNSLKYCEISYASIGLRIKNSHATIDNCVVQLAKYYGAAVIGSANPDFNNTQFFNINQAPIELSMFSNPTFTDCSALNVGYMALAVIPETYSQTATVPIRNFGGYTNITYFMNDQCTINSGTTITIPAGIVFKSTASSYIDGDGHHIGSSQLAHGFIVNGRINIQGTSENPVVFTNDKDDNYGNPLDMNQNGTASQPPNGVNPHWSGTWIYFSDASDDLSSVNHVVMKYGDRGIALSSTSPVISNTRFENLYYGVDMNGVSAPKIDNCTFNNLQYYPMQISLVSYPASTTNNSISGTTYKVIKVRDETLTQDVTLPKRDFGGVVNIPYYFEKYVIGTGATLTINPGIVCKFSDYPDGYPDSYYDSYAGRLDIFKGLSAMGGASPDSTIVFTSIKDDFYGGDSNSDSTFTTATSGKWNGLIFEDQSLDPLCKLKNCIIRYARKGIKTVSASPGIENSSINNNYYGVYASAASNPVFSNCDFQSNYSFAINNVDKSFVINAKNCWWGSNLGPVQTNTPGNGTNPQQIVTTAVDFTPWNTTGAGNPQMGDVSLNGKVQGYDASLVLQHVVGNISLNSIQQRVADVSGGTGITAYDASLISQFAVGLIRSFPAELKKADLSALTDPQLIVGSANAVNGQDTNIPLNVRNVSGMFSAEIKLQYDPAYLQIKQVAQLVSGMNMCYRIDSINGILTIAMAGTSSLESDTILAQITFRTLSPTENKTLNALTVLKFLANESNRTSGVINGSISTNSDVTGVSSDIENTTGSIVLIYPNPSTGNTMLTYQLKRDKQHVNIEVINLMGQNVITLVNETKDSGNYRISISNQGNTLNNGVYFIRMTVDGISHSQKFLIVK